MRWPRSGRHNSQRTTDIAERRAVRIANTQPKQFWWGSLGWVLFFVYPLIPGWLLKSIFGEVKRGTYRTRFAALLITLFVVEAIMATIIRYAHRSYMAGFNAAQCMMRLNVMNAQLASGGRDRGPREVSSGDAVVRMRDDPNDVLLLVDNWLDVVGTIGYAIVAIGVLASIDLLAAVATFVPLFIVGILNRFAGNHLRKLRGAARAATSASTEFLAAAFGSANTIKVSGAQPGFLHRIDELNRVRADAMVKDQVWSDSLWNANGAAVDISVGVALLVASRRNLSVSDVTLFASYLLNLVWLPQKVGGMFVGRRRFWVAAKRLEAMLPTSLDSDPLTELRSAPFLTGHHHLVQPTMTRPVRMPLQSVSVRGLTISERGVNNISFDIPRGSLTVISGPVGSGKTSLVKGLLGLLPIDEGEVLWNGKQIDDLGSFFVPPQCAYVSQVPTLFSESLADNLLLGALFDPTDAIQLAAFDDDVASFPNGLNTRLGSGGVRLSGGQVQRAAAARALVHGAELIVFDDLTSALDVETELRLWDRLHAANATVLAISNRSVALSRADQIVEL
jgi:ATP-binding cassette, subfamily B, bacterial